MRSPPIWSVPPVWTTQFEMSSYKPTDKYESLGTSAAIRIVPPLVTHTLSYATGDAEPTHDAAVRKSPSAMFQYRVAAERDVQHRTPSPTTMTSLVQSSDQHLGVAAAAPIITNSLPIFLVPFWLANAL